MDLKKYATNLRKAGCPESTIALIVLEELRQRSLPRITAIVDTVRHRFYEELAKSKGDISDLAKPERKELEALAEEMEELIERALGNSYSLSFDDASEIATHTALLEVLSAEQAAAAVDIRRRHRSSEVPKKSSGQSLGLEAEELKALLGENKYAELLLLQSPGISIIRERSGFDATPSEWKDILATQHACETTNAAERVVTEALAQLLGPDRAFEFEDHSRPDYRELHDLIHEAGLPSGLIKEACELEAAFHKREQEVESAPMPDILKRAEISALRQAGQAALQTLLGEGPAEAYKHAQLRRWQR
jgi:hypothetical protein